MKEDKSDSSIMELELAFQRERAYQAKVARMKLQAQLGFMEMFRPMKYNISYQMHSSRPSSNSDATLGSGPAVSGVKRQVTTGSSKCNQSLKRKASNGSHVSKEEEEEEDKLFCKICQVTCPGAISYNQHIEGQKHRTRLIDLKFDQKQIAEEGKSQRQWCELCDTWCMNQNSYEDHLGGQKHCSKLKKLESKNCCSENRKQAKYCNQCKVWHRKI